MSCGTGECGCGCGDIPLLQIEGLEAEQEAPAALGEAASESLSRKGLQEGLRARGDAVFREGRGSDERSGPG